MAIYACEECGIGNCEFGIVTDECDPITFLSRFHCPQGFSIGHAGLVNADDHYHRDNYTGIPLGTKEGKCILDWQPCDKPEICEDCKECSKVKSLMRRHPDVLSEPMKVDGEWRCPLTKDHKCEYPVKADHGLCEDCKLVQGYGPADDFGAAEYAWYQEETEQP